MRCLGVIHARGGSRRIPRKNAKLMLGIPLLAYSVRAALASRISRVIVSTDDDEIAEIGRKYGAEVPFRRPKDISEDVPSEDVTLHALNWAEADEGKPYDVVVTIQPTTPFVTAEDMDACIATLESNAEAACCFTASRVKEPPQWMFAVGENGFATTLLAGGIQGERGVFQSLPPLYLPNGAAYATRTASFRSQNKVIAEPSCLHPMTHERSVDLDEPIDWAVAEAVGTQKGFSLIPLK